MKKAALSFQFIVLAILALLFLVLVAVMMTGKIGQFQQGLTNCENKGGICVPQDGCYGTQTSFACDDPSYVCCLNTCEGQGGECKTSCSDSEEQLFIGACPDSGSVCCR